MVSVLRPHTSLLRSLWRGIGALCLATLLLGCGGDHSHTLIIGMEAKYPPFEMIDKDGQFTGVSVDLGRALAKDLGKEADFRNIPFGGLITALKSGRIDCIISSMTATDERRQSIDFSDPYVKTRLAMLVPANSTVKDLKDLETPGRRIAVKLGTTGETFARQHLPQAKIVTLTEDVACVLEVTKGSVDAWIYDQLSVARYHEKNPDTTKALLTPLSEESWSIGLRKGDDALRQQVNAFLAKFRADGGFQKLAEKYKPLTDGQPIPFVTEP